MHYNFSYLKIKKSDLLRVWDIRKPFIPWNVNKALNEFNNLVLNFENFFPYQATWLCDQAINNQNGWSLFSKSDSITTDEDSFKSGGWATFFFKESPKIESLSKITPIYPRKAKDALQIVCSIQAEAAIWSWYDNREWTVVFPNEELVVSG